MNVFKLSGRLATSSKKRPKEWPAKGENKEYKEILLMKPTSYTKTSLAVLILSVSAFAAVCLGADNVVDALRLKAMDGDVKAMKELGDYYLGEYRTEDGKRLAVKKNRTEAAKWYGQAARKGNLPAMRRLVKDDQLPVEREDRLYWLGRMGSSANQLDGDEKIGIYLQITDAYLKLRDKEKGIDWAFKAFDLVTSVTNDWCAIKPAQFACALRGEESPGKKLDEMPWIVDFPAHVRFLKYAIDKDLPRRGNYDDNVLLRTLMGEAYEKGFGVAQDLKEAYKWHVNAVDYAKTHACRTRCVGYAQRRVGECLRYGKGCKRNLAEAVKWYEKAALNCDLEARNQFAEWCLGGLVEIGTSELTARQAVGSQALLLLAAGENMPVPRSVIEPNVSRAEELSETGVYAWCDEQEVIASHRLCRIYHARGEWDKMVKALQGWQKSFQGPFKNPFKAKMMYWLGGAYVLGKGVQADSAKGRELIKEAARLGDPEAMEILDKKGIDYDVKRDK